MQKLNHFENNIRNLHLVTVISLCLLDIQRKPYEGPLIIIHGLGHYYECKDILDYLIGNLF